jgi:S1-C subfamily serine protease
MKDIRQRFTGMRFIAPALAAALAATFAIGGAIGFTSHRQPQSLIPAASASNGMNGMAPLTMSFAPIIKNAQPAVVSIASTKVVKISSGDEGLSPLFDDPMFRQFFGDGPQNRFGKPREQREQGLGSGVIVAADGYILTNNHVIDDANEIRIYTSDKRELKARVIGADPKTDIAVVKVEAKNLPTLPFADSSQAQVGDIVLAIGNPFGVGQTVTMGIISATGRGNLGIEDYEDFIQTDAAINPGNSGGALINASGQLIGVNTAILSRAGGNQGVGFAVPANLAPGSAIRLKLLRDGNPREVNATLGELPNEKEAASDGKPESDSPDGLSVENLTPQIARQLGLQSNASGVVVTGVQDGSRADDAGLRRGDVIQQVNRQPVNNVAEFERAMKQAGDKSAALLVNRNGHTSFVALAAP